MDKNRYLKVVSINHRNESKAMDENVALLTVFADMQNLLEKINIERSSLAELNKKISH